MVITFGKLYSYSIIHKVFFFEVWASVSQIKLTLSSLNTKIWISFWIFWFCCFLNCSQNYSNGFHMRLSCLGVRAPTFLRSWLKQPFNVPNSSVQLVVQFNFRICSCTLHIQKLVHKQTLLLIRLPDCWSSPNWASEDAGWEGCPTKRPSSRCYQLEHLKTLDHVNEQ